MSLDQMRHHLLLLPAGTPSNINYVRLQHPSGNDLTKVLSVDFFDGRVYAAAEFSDGRIFHYYDGVRITDWFDGRARAKIQITAGTQGGTAATGSFTVSAGTANPGDDIRVVRVNGVEINDLLIRLPILAITRQRLQMLQTL